MMKQLFLYFIIFSSINVLGQNVYIPDVNFKNYLLSHAGINSNLDTAIQVSEANAFNGILDISSKNISNLTGIEAFINLTDFRCYDNLISGSLDMSNSLNLKHLDCSENTISNINIVNNLKLEYLSIYDNQITTIDVSNNDSLKNLIIAINPIPSVNLTNNLKLSFLNIRETLITSINLTNNILLEQFYAKNTPLSNLNLANNPNLKQFEIKYTPLASLDFSNNPNLELVLLDSNSTLSSLNFKNGNNTSILYITLLGNPNLTCIQVDDSAYSTNNWTNIDPQHFFSENCATSVKELEQNQWLTVFPNPAKTKITININNEALSKKLTLKLISLEGKNILQKYLNSTVNTFDINHLPAGFYTLSLHNNGSIFANKKIIISH